ncbi:MAG: AmmeMemoRadiSam system radical SAM enzyme [Bacteroidota bacterium]
MFPASFYTENRDHQVQCTLCPHLCLLQQGETGICKTRVNRAGKLYTRSYGVLSAIATDPVEKKPLYHFLPGRPILSIGSFGCNFMCDFCQNCNISQPDEEVFSIYPVREPADIVAKAMLHKESIGLAYTYNEPTVYFEYVMDCAQRLRKLQLKNVMVTNGYINRKPLEALLPYMDAFNIDLKSFTNGFYKERASASLNPVLDTIARVANSESHLELTFLIIPGYNDNPSEWKEMIGWIETHCGPDTILHVSRYFPRHKLRSFPTTTDTMNRFIKAAREKIRYVYPGNNPEIENHTYCPGCGKLLIQREMYNTTINGLTPEGDCSHCNYRVKGVFKPLAS